MSGTTGLPSAEATAELTAPGGRFEVTTAMVRGVETKVWANAPGSLRDVLDLSKGYDDRTFIVYEDERYTFAEHYVLVATMAQRLLDRGVVPGDRVAIAMRNLPEWIISFWAIISVGAVAVPLNAWWTTDELVYGLDDSGTVLAIIDAERLERLAGHLDGISSLRGVIVASEARTPVAGMTEAAHRVTVEAYADVMEDGEVVSLLPSNPIEPDDDATIFYTSGTTGRPKGAVGTHRNSASNLMNLFFVSSRTALRVGGEAGPSTPNRYLLSVPLFHATGCQAILVVNTAAGGTLVMMHHFDPERALELIERERVTTFGGVPTMVMRVLDSPDFTTRDTSSVRNVSYGGAPAPPELVRRITAAFPIGQPGNGYGMTETSAATAMNSGPDYVARPESVGQAVPTVDVAIVPEDFEGTSPDPDRPSGPEVTGELWIKGPNVVRGYWNRPVETAAVFTDGWVHTGDVARIDDEGFIYIVDRAKDVIIRGGENIYSVEVEAALFEHPAVADCAVIGVPHPVLSEEVGAVIVPRPGMSVTAEELSAHVAERLAGYNVPAHYYFTDEPLPRNPAGKVLKRELRTRFVEA
jgi:long-chain acyl-CoA synthetase